jgi:hypothetical protein
MRAVGTLKALAAVQAAAVPASSAVTTQRLGGGEEGETGQGGGGEVSATTTTVRNVMWRRSDRISLVVDRLSPRRNGGGMHGHVPAFNGVEVESEGGEIAHPPISNLLHTKHHQRAARFNSTYPVSCRHVINRIPKL